MDSQGLLNIFIFLAAGTIAVPLASRLKLGSVLGYLAAGVVIGPFGLGLIGEAERIMHIAEFGVVMMMFLIGMELEPAVLWRLRHSILGLGSLQVILSSLALMALGMALGLEWRGALALGMAMAMSSTALVMQMLREKGLTHSLMGETSFSVLLFQDMAVIPILVIIPLLAGTGGGAEVHASLISHWPVWLQALAVAATIAGVIVIGRFTSRKLLPAIARVNLREVFTAASLLMVMGVTLLMELVGMSAALGAFVAGVVLASSEYRRTIESDIEPFKGLLLGLFFISVGMGMDFGAAASQPVILVGLVVGLMAIKTFILWGLGDRFGLDGAGRLGMALALSQAGEFAFVLLQLIGGLSLIDPAMQKLATLAVAISIAATPIISALYSRYLLPRFFTLLKTREYDQIDERNAVIIAGFGRFGQIVGRFMMHQGVNVTILEKNPDQVEFIRRFGFNSFFGDASRLDLLHNAGAAEARLLVIAIDDPDAAVEIVRMAKLHFPQMKIYARARNRRHSYELHKAGVDYYHRETLDASLSLAREAMVALGFSRRTMEAKAKRFLEHDKESLKESFAFFESEPDLVNYARLRQAELERILRGDVIDDKVETSAKMKETVST